MRYIFTVFRIRIQSGQWIRIWIRIRNPDRIQEGEMAHKNRKNKKF